MSRERGSSAAARRRLRSRASGRRPAASSASPSSRRRLRRPGREPLAPARRPRRAATSASPRSSAACASAEGAVAGVRDGRRARRGAAAAREKRRPSRPRGARHERGPTPVELGSRTTPRSNGAQSHRRELEVPVEHDVDEERASTPPAPPSRSGLSDRTAGSASSGVPSSDHRAARGRPARARRAPRGTRCARPSDVQQRRPLPDPRALEAPRALAEERLPPDHSRAPRPSSRRARLVDVLRSRSGAPCCAAGADARLAGPRARRRPPPRLTASARDARDGDSDAGRAARRSVGGLQRRTAAAPTARAPSTTRLAASPPREAGSAERPEPRDDERHGARDPCEQHAVRRPVDRDVASEDRRAPARQPRATRARARGRAPQVAGTATPGAERRVASEAPPRARPRPMRIVVVARMPGRVCVPDRRLETAGRYAGRARRARRSPPIVDDRCAPEHAEQELARRGGAAPPGTPRPRRPRRRASAPPRAEPHPAPPTTTGRPPARPPARARATDHARARGDPARSRSARSTPPAKQRGVKSLAKNEAAPTSARSDEPPLGPATRSEKRAGNHDGGEASGHPSKA